MLIRNKRNICILHASYTFHYYSYLKFQFDISHSWLTFYNLLLDAIFPTEEVILYFQSINDIYQTIMDNEKYKTYKIQKKQSYMSVISES